MPRFRLIFDRLENLPQLAVDTVIMRLRTIPGTTNSLTDRTRQRTPYPG